MLNELQVGEFLAALGERTPAPASGAATALTGALAAGLAELAARFADDDDAVMRAKAAVTRLVQLADEDSAAYAAFMADRNDETRARIIAVPQEIAALALQNKKLLYAILFRASAEALREIGVDPKHLGAELGFLSVLHTWGQTLEHHPHIHCVIAGGGLAPDGSTWVSCRPGFFLPVRVLSRLFRGKFLHHLKKAFRRGKMVFHGRLMPLRIASTFRSYLKPVFQREWVVYAKSPFGGPAQVLDYLARYTHRVAISNHRLVSMTADSVTFTWKDYRLDGQKRTMTLDADGTTGLYVLP